MLHSLHRDAGLYIAVQNEATVSKSVTGAKKHPEPAWGLEG